MLESYHKREETLARKVNGQFAFILVMHVAAVIDFVLYDPDVYFAILIGLLHCQSRHG
jgi:hypothetical protein